MKAVTGTQSPQGSLSWIWSGAGEGIWVIFSSHRALSTHKKEKLHQNHILVLPRSLGATIVAGMRGQAFITISPPPLCAPLTKTQLTRLGKSKKHQKRHRGGRPVSSPGPQKLKSGHRQTAAAQISAKPKLQPRVCNSLFSTRYFFFFFSIRSLSKHKRLLKGAFWHEHRAFIMPSNGSLRE